MMLPAVPVAIGLGSNVGDRGAHLARARGRIAADIAPLERISTIYETDPVGPAGQGRYLNQVVLLRSARAPEEILAGLQRIESASGRRRTVRWAARTIDLDLLLCGRAERRSATLVLPHPRLHERAFVLVPLAEVLPDWRHPGLDLRVTELLARVDRAGVVVWAGNAQEDGSSKSRRP